MPKILLVRFFSGHGVDIVVESVRTLYFNCSVSWLNKQYFLRCDKADRNGYYKYTGDNITPLIARLDVMLASKEFDPGNINDIYADIVRILSNGATMFVPRRGKQFFLNSGGMKNSVYLRKARWTVTECGLPLVDHALQARCILVDSKVG